MRREAGCKCEQFSGADNKIREMLFTGIGQDKRAEQTPNCEPVKVVEVSRELRLYG